MNNSLPTQARLPIPDFCRITGLGRTTVYDRISRGLLRVVKDGRRTFIARAELDRYLSACEAVPASSQR